MKKNISAEKSAQTAGKILTAAQTVFAENGYSGAHMDEIARRAGVNKATLYYQIGDKDALYAGVIHQVLGSIAGRIADAVAQAQSPPEKLAAYIQSIAKAVEKNPELPSIMLREVASDGAHLPRIVAEDMSAVLITLAGILEDGKRKGLFTNVVPFLIHCMIMGAILMYQKVSPIKDRQLWLPADVKRHDQKLSGSLGEEVAKLILRAVTKDTGGKS